MADEQRTSAAGERGLTRRRLIGAGVGAASLAAGVGTASAKGTRRSFHPDFPSSATFDFNGRWRFGGAYRPGSQNPGHSERGFHPVTLPHTVARLSWGNWPSGSWEGRWIYRKSFSARELPLGRTLLEFEAVMTDATVYLNGLEVARHLGGYLPFTVELTDYLHDGENLLAVVVDGLPLDVPPASPAGDQAIDYLQPAGITRDVTLQVVPNTYVSDVFARAVDVLSGAPELIVGVTVDSNITVHHVTPTVTVDLLDGGQTVATASEPIRIRSGTQSVQVHLPGLQGIALWSPDAPKLYTVRVRLESPSAPTHTVTQQTGFREATFTTSGFYLNGERLQIFGLNHHALFPYTGMAASARMQARDAQILKNELRCNMVRCSHYPQSSHFLDECDRLGLMVWEEPPGWQYVGDESFKEIFIQNVHDMIVRDRSRPSVVVWGTRPDETYSYPTLFAQARSLAYTLDGTRQTTGAMDTRSTTGWAEDVFSYDDYSSQNGQAELQPPLPGIPYLVSEAVGALDGPPLYRWVDPSSTLQAQARLHAQVNAIAAANPAYCGVLAWCGMDYDSYLGGLQRNWQGLRWPGVTDTFRVPKPGAAFYRSQVSPTVTPVILPAFFWDFGPNSPSTGPGPNSILATNCEQLAIYIDGQETQVATPDTADYGGLAYPPVLADLTVTAGTLPQLEVVGYVGGQAVASLQMAGDPSGDHLSLTLDHPSIVGDGSDSTRLTVRAVDAFGNQRPYVAGNVALSVTGGAAELIGQNPFPFALYGGVGGAFVRSYPGHSGSVVATASHPTLGTVTATLTVTPARGRFL